MAGPVRFQPKPSRFALHCGLRQCSESPARAGNVPNQGQTQREDTHAVQGFAEDAQRMSAEEWQARVDLAAAHRLAYMHDFSEGIFNHLTLVVPGRRDRYYQSRSACIGPR